MGKFLVILFYCSVAQAFASEAYFKELNTLIQTHYSAPILKMGCEEFEVTGHFSINRYAASANWEKHNDCSIAILSGYFLAPTMGEAVHLLVLCHEVGHYLGGQPKKIESNKERWSSAEGQADYYSTHTCFKEMLRYYPEVKTRLMKNAFIPLAVKHHCDVPGIDFEICELSIMAGFYKLKVENSLIVRPDDQWHVSSVEEALVKKSTLKVESTLRGNFDYPTPQCQFDTYVAGSLNLKRPACWFKEE